MAVPDGGEQAVTGAASNHRDRPPRGDSVSHGCLHHLGVAEIRQGQDRPVRTRSDVDATWTVLEDAGGLRHSGVAREPSAALACGLAIFHWTILRSVPGGRPAVRCLAAGRRIATVGQGFTAAMGRSGVGAWRRPGLLVYSRGPACLCRA